MGSTVRQLRGDMYRIVYYEEMSVRGRLSEAEVLRLAYECDILMLRAPQAPAPIFLNGQPNNARKTRSAGRPAELLFA